MNVKKILDVINIADVYPSTTGNSTVDPEAGGDEVRSRTAEANLLTDHRSDDVTLANGLGQ